MKEQTLEKLKNLGLKNNEAKIYLALLELGRGSVTQISQKAGLNRTTGYDILENLGLYGIVGRIKVSNKRVYVAHPPSSLKLFLENKKKSAERRLVELKDTLPELDMVYKTDLKPVVKFAEGVEEMKNIYERVLSSNSKIYSILNPNEFAKIFDEYGTYTANERLKRGIKEEIIALKSEGADWWHNKTYKGSKRKQENTKYRWTETGKKDDPIGEVVIFDDIVIVLLSKPGEHVAFEIKSQSFADFLKILFKLAWKQIGVKKVTKKSTKKQNKKKKK